MQPLGELACLVHFVKLSHQLQSVDVKLPFRIPSSAPGVHGDVAPTTSTRIVAGVNAPPRYVKRRLDVLICSNFVTELDPTEKFGIGGLRLMNVVEGSSSNGLDGGGVGGVGAGGAGGLGSGAIWTIPEI